MTRRALRSQGRRPSAIAIKILLYKHWYYVKWNLNRCQSQSALPSLSRDVTTSCCMQGSRPTPVRKERVLHFVGDRACYRTVLLSQTGVICLVTAILDLDVCSKTEFLWNTLLSNENGKFLTTMIYAWLNRWVCFSMGLANWRFGFCLTGGYIVFSDVADRILNVKSSNWVERSPWILGA